MDSKNSVRKEFCTLWLQLVYIGEKNVFFQQDGVTCHTARETGALLYEKFSRRAASLNCDVNWVSSVGLCQLSGYENKPRTIPFNITCTIVNLPTSNKSEEGILKHRFLCTLIISCRFKVLTPLLGNLL